MYSYTHPAYYVSADVVVTHGQLVLLIKRKKEPFKDQWALPGGFLEPDETVDRCAIRELIEETSIEARNMSVLGVFSEPERDPRGRVLSVAFLLRCSEPPLVRAGDDALEAAWHNRKDILAGNVKVAFDHADIINVAFGGFR